MKSDKTRKLVYIALTGAMAYLLARFTKFPLFPQAPFLKLDFGEVPLIIMSTLGSLSTGIFALLVKELLSFTISGSNFFGLIADFVACGSFLTVFCLLYKQNSLSKTLLAGVAGGLARMLVAIPLNIIVLHFQYGTTLNGVIAQLHYILPFNFIKSALDCVCLVYLYPKLKNAMPPMKEQPLITERH